MSNDKIEISFDDEDEQPKPREKKLIITSDDLLNVPDPQPLAAQKPVGFDAPADSYMQYQKKPSASAVSGHSIMQGAIAGLIGGFLAWAVTEPLFGDNVASSNFVSIIVKMGFFGGLIGGLIGGCLGAADGVVSGVAEKAFKAGAIGLGIGMGGGFLGGVFGQIVYGALLQSGEPGLGTYMVARTIGWSVVGVFVGLGQGVGRGSGKRVTNGLLGGLAGGFIAGILFDPISVLFATGLLSRLFGITILGAAAGLAVGLVEEMRKQAWLSIVKGPLAGKQFILYEQRTRIGSSPKCEISLVKDPQVMPEHIAIDNHGSSFSLSALMGQALVDGRPVHQTRLQAGNMITLGSTSLLFEEKAIGQ
ncbi:MAG: FHA domain-containing protein [Armatimonadetes bacterium]|jgi:hypothetical protein|nr:FHA domain-containing protein [Armatimonadota bacterium]